MDIKIFLAIFLLYQSITLCFATHDHESDLITDLLSNYNLRARPASSAQDVVEVNISMHIIKLQEVNTKFQFISVLGWLNAHWYDARLKWNSTDYGGINFITLPSYDIWIPTFVLANTASDQLYNEFWYTLFKVQVNSDGHLKWSPGGIFKAECQIDVQLFPFDEQICQFRFENWVYPGNKVNLSYTFNAREKMMSFYSIENGQWHILDTAIARCDKYFLDDLEFFPRVYFAIHLKRKSLYYITNTIFISVLLAILVLFIFNLPAESGERIAMGVTLLLAFSFFILMINDSIPKTSSAVPIIIIYLICFMALTTLAICESVFVLFCYHHNGEHGGPIRLQKFSKLIKDVFACKSRSEALDGKFHGTGNPLRCIDKNPMEKYSEKDNKLCKQEWQEISRQIDMFCFWLFLILFLFIFVVLLIVVPIVCNQKDLTSAVDSWIKNTQ